MSRNTKETIPCIILDGIKMCLDSQNSPQLKMMKGKAKDFKGKKCAGFLAEVETDRNYKEVSESLF